ncbi:hypothetical protein Afil01_40890 [Actinorhabdospora filicis]|uniref:CRP-like cAMP-binding protein n=1 Tax=Actinorhabdospora filicis TaxID=1785913 RepID=A0A9W6W4H9_9ACTN|nr:Crp/Fnr family transcriptional regulator [Actinorhabdospora filicis]GLZ79282.1 hypothetical protein Afil01_40890 [Actinorhabdospora filicis]
MDGPTELPPGEDFTPEQFALLRAAGTLQRRPAGQLLIAEGETSDHVMILLRGHAMIAFAGSDRTLEILPPGTVVGDIAALLNSPRTADVIALTDVTALVLPGATWLSFLEANPTAAIRQLAGSYRRLLHVNRRKVIDRFPAERRLAITMADLAALRVWDDEDGAGVIRLKQEQLAGLTGLKRDSVVGVLRDFKNAGIVEVRRGVTRIIDPARLDRIGRGELVAS